MGNTQTVEIETASDRVVCRWPRDFFTNCIPDDEDVLLSKSSGSDEGAKFKVEHLSQREVHLAPGDYQLRLERYFRPETEVRTPVTPTPAISWISDSPVSHLISWQGFNWEEVRREVERIHRLDWDTEAAVAVRVLRNNEGKLKNDWVPVPFRDHVTLEGIVEEV